MTSHSGIITFAFFHTGRCAISSASSAAVCCGMPSLGRSHWVDSEAVCFSSMERRPLLWVGGSDVPPRMKPIFAAGRRSHSRSDKPFEQLHFHQVAWLDIALRSGQHDEAIGLRHGRQYAGALVAGGAHSPCTTVV